MCRINLQENEDVSIENFSITTAVHEAAFEALGQQEKNNRKNLQWWIAKHEPFFGFHWFRGSIWLSTSKRSMAEAGRFSATTSLPTDQECRGLIPCSALGSSFSDEVMHLSKEWVFLCVLSLVHGRRPRWSRGNVLASRSKIRGFKPGWGRWIFFRT